MDLWVTELQAKDLKLSCLVNKTLFYEKSPFQEVAVVETSRFGRMLLLDGVIQTTVADEFVYHEMITHVGLYTHPNPRRVLVIGGGDGGSIREIIRHKSVEKATLVEIDGKVIEASKKHLPEISCALDDPKVEVIVDDGIKYIKDNKNTFDMIIIDSTDPIGPATGLFSGDFYKDVHEALTPDGLFVAQTESPFYNADLIPRIIKDVSAIFSVTRLFTAFVPTYPGGLWSFTMGSKLHDPMVADIRDFNMETKYYTPEVHKASFVLPPFVKKLVK